MSEGRIDRLCHIGDVTLTGGRRDTRFLIGPREAGRSQGMARMMSHSAMHYQNCSGPLHFERTVSPSSQNTLPVLPVQNPGESL